jgi:hypothetical protein
MNYYISRDGQQYGPYTLADLQRYVAAGSILVTDMTRSEGMTDWIPVSQVIGNIPVPLAPQMAAAAPGTLYPDPPNLHWAIVLLLAVVTCGLFGWVWIFIEAAWVRKVRPQAKSMIYAAVAVSLLVVTVFLKMNKDTAPLGTLLNLGGIVMWLVAVFSMRSDIEEHYNSAEPIALVLSGVMTFFFNVYYFQYHFTRINELKRSGQFATLAGGSQGLNLQ